MLRNTSPVIDKCVCLAFFFKFINIFFMCVEHQKVEKTRAALLMGGDEAHPPVSVSSFLSSMCQ